ncbi:MAG: putative metalloprotease [Flavobacterium sp.]
MIILSIVAAVMCFTGNNPLNFLMDAGNSSNQVQSSTSYKGTAKENELAGFSATVLTDTKDIWNKIIPNYREPTLVIFSGAVNSACRYASSTAGPFYCSADAK